MGYLIIKVKNLLVKALEIVVVIVMAILVLDVLWGVISRFIFGNQSKWTEELATMLLIWVSLLGAAVAFGTKSHLGVDYFVKKLHIEAEKLNEIIVNLLIIFFAVAILIVGGYSLVSETLAAGQVSPALGLKFGYVYLAVPISGIFIVLFCVEAIVEVLIGGTQSGEDDAGKDVK